MILRILSPLEDIYKSNEVLSLSSCNSAGNFDVLPQHANFITLVDNQPITVKLTSGEKKVFNFPLAVIHARQDTIDIYTDLGLVEKILPEPKLLS